MSQDQLQSQSLAAKKAESQRPFHGQLILDDPNVGSLFRHRAKVLLADLKALESRGVSFSPFLEIGAGSVHRSAALINNYTAVGVATDISQRSLQDTPYTLSLLDCDQAPLLICCDAHHLPFLPNSFQFVFAYQTLHHFENPVPVLTECHRVLGQGGHLFFSEEPMDSALRRRLRGQRTFSDPLTTMQKLATRLGVHTIFWQDGAPERSLGMTEARFEIDLWRKALQPFRVVEVEVNRRFKIHSDLQKPFLNAVLSGVIGGNVKGLCQKTEGQLVAGDLHERLLCVDCSSTQLSRVDDAQLICHNCAREYPIVDGVIRMLPEQLEIELYQAGSNAG
jgi:SAM-dependent methyltransferase